ncbi:hypothetical protein HDU87_004363 [Geranomyces variabilis]|uniref:Tetratricopeptide SHNi-TPR domain-containing protein n=1 Tax=Geranomyces variabilis TaxID=109894 RepID=A0AAD5XM04_9FUNG|nr:hypothetical protein HDU87_004363 [Geranomyces variabilis]
MTSADDENDIVAMQASALEMLKQGDLLLTQKEYSAAADILSDAVASLSAVYGDGAPECSRALHVYGVALYNLAVEKSSVLGPSTLDAEEKEAAAAAMIELMQKGANRFAFGGDGDDDAIPAPAVASGSGSGGGDGSSSKSATTADGQHDEEQVNEEDDDEDAPVDDLELAYEILTVAAAAYSASPQTDETKAGLADVHLHLGHYHLESDRAQEAQDEYHAALDIKLALLPSCNDRELAQVRYAYAITLEATGKYAAALEQVNLALGHLRTRVAALETKSALSSSATSTAPPDRKGKKPAVANDAQNGINAEEARDGANGDEAEMRELGEMVKDLEAKVEEIGIKMDAAAKAAAGGASGEGGESGDVKSPFGNGSSLAESTAVGTAASPAGADALPKPIADISGLVKKRKKLEPVIGAAVADGSAAGALAHTATADGPESKKLKSET